MNLQEKLKENWQFILVCAFAILFLLGTNFFVTKMNSDGLVKWLSPDENANYVFAKLFAENNALIINDNLNKDVADIIHPRSFRSDNGELKPVSFLGIILVYGFLGSIFGAGIIPYLTSLFAFMGIVFYFLLLRNIFNRQIALISTILLCFFPVYIYYTTRSMFHNILFNVFLIIGLYFISHLGVKRDSKFKLEFFIKDFLTYDKKNLELLATASLSGLFIGLAVLSRTSELLWLAPSLIILWFLNIKKIGITQLVVFIIFFIIGYSPAFYYNYQLYGSIWQGGYHEMNQSIVDITSAGAGIFSDGLFSKDVLMQNFEVIKKNIFFFGFKSLESWQQFINYFMVMFFWIFWPAIFGLSHVIDDWKKQLSNQKKFLITYFFVLVMLMFYYGSWTFNDNPNLASITIGNSYTRYWLPIYLGALPLASIFIINLANIIVFKANKEINTFLPNYNYIQDGTFVSSLNLLENSRRRKIFGSFFTLNLKFFKKQISDKFLKNTIVIVVVSIMCFISINYVLVGSEEGLVVSYYNHSLAKNEAKMVFSLTPVDSVIITRYHDKMLFPERRVVVGLFDDKRMIEKYQIIAKNVPLFYFNFTLRQEDIDYLNNRRLGEFGLSIQAVEEINDFSLYEVKIVEK
ncbi:glycosyltransferase family 39 protein [Patescibacteria group bacterium]|nr:glycosyltransferase family 39 protein [Patescibacteria group bacterium]